MMFFSKLHVSQKEENTKEDIKRRKSKKALK